MMTLQELLTETVQRRLLSVGTRRAPRTPSERSRCGSTQQAFRYERRLPCSTASASSGRIRRSSNDSPRRQGGSRQNSTSRHRSTPRYRQWHRAPQRGGSCFRTRQSSIPLLCEPLHQRGDRLCYGIDRLPQRVKCELRIGDYIPAWLILNIGIQDGLRRSEDNWFSEQQLRIDIKRPYSQK